MTENEGLTCTNPQEMLKFLPGKGSARKHRLFAGACVLHIPTEGTSRKTLGQLGTPPFPSASFTVSGIDWTGKPEF